MAEPVPQARVVKSLTRDRHIRLSSVDASPLWDGVRRGHPHLEPAACACLTELLTATALLQGRTLFAERLQLLVKGSGRAKAVVADRWPDGTFRGVLDPGSAAAEAWIEAPGVFQVMRSNATGQPYVGHLPLVAGGRTLGVWELRWPMPRTWTAEDLLYLKTAYVKRMKNEADNVTSFARWHRLVLSAQAGQPANKQ